MVEASTSSNRPRQPLADRTTKKANQRIHLLQESDLLASKGGPQNPRLSAISDETSGDSKRFSQTSSSSSNSTSRKLKTHVGPWQLGKSLGHGMSARVRKARHRESGQLAAVKIIGILQAANMQTASILDMEKRVKQRVKQRGKKAVSDRDESRDEIPMVLKREITILKTIEHPNIVRLFDIWENRGEIYMFMELVDGGELFEYVKRHSLPEYEVARLFRQIISGLQYCHRFRLCHRDLKPENILLDRLGNVKLADFGMAAMHQGQYLHTACGSPHYAAPEVCRGASYSGDFADVWSAGVVLYVMLFEALPFGSHCGADDIKTIVKEVQNKVIEFPDRDDVSNDARDFLLEILQREPSRRMTIPMMWQHSWLTYYDNFAAQPENQATWIGGPLPPLSIADCGPPIKHISEIDRSTIKMLCTLWHTDDEKRFVKALLGPHACYEKVMYNNLKKFRTEQEEQYMAPNLSSSASDYHHISKSLQKSATRGSLLGSMSGSSQQRSVSQFSIVQPGSRQPSMRSHRSNGTHCTGSVAATETTYDPYRSSRPQVVYQGNAYTRVDVFRGNSAASKGTTSTRASSTRGPPPVGRRGPASSIWESTVASSMMSMSMPSSPPLARDEQGQIRTIRHTGPVKRVFSSSSFGSSISRVNSTTGTSFVKSSSFKRPIKFVSKRQKMVSPARPSNPTPSSLGQSLLADSNTQEHSEKGSNDASSPQPIGGHQSLPEMKTGGGYIPDGLRLTSKSITSADGGRNMLPTPQELALRASSELSAYCDEVFGPSPVPTSSASSKPMTPNEILAARLYSSKTPSKTSSLREEYRQRPLPDPPIREAHALQIQRDLAKMQRFLKAKEKELGTSLMKEALDEIERMMRKNAPMITEANYERRIASAPTPDRERMDTGGLVTDKQGRRYFSDPVPRPLYGQGPGYDGPTIRFVPPSSPCDPTQRPYGDEDTSIVFGGGVAAAPNNRLSEPRVVPRRRGSREHLSGHDNDNSRGSVTLSMYETRLQTIEEAGEREIEAAEDAPKRGSAGSMMKSLFKRSTRSIKSIEQKDVQTAASPQPLFDRVTDTPCVGPLSYDRPPSRGVAAWQDEVRDAMTLPMPIPSFAQTHASSEFPARREPPIRPSSAAVSAAASASTPTKKTPNSARNWFTNIFKRDRNPNMAVIEPSEASSIGQLSSQRHSNNNGRMAPPNRSSNQPPFPTLINRKIPVYEPYNWFARLLQVKPASMTLVFEASRIHVIKEVRSILRDWKRFGVREIVIDKHEGRIWASLNADNSLGVKPVEIVVQVFAVVYTANKKLRNAGGMSIAKMEQVKGAKSSFDRCAHEMQRVCGERQLLVTDYEKAKEMKRVLKEFMK